MLENQLFFGKQIFTHGSKAEDGEKERPKVGDNTPGTAGGPGGRDQVEKLKKRPKKSAFFRTKIKNYFKKIFLS